MSRVFVRRLPTAVALLLLGTCWGCGTAEYEARMEASVRSAGEVNIFNELDPAIQIGKTPVKIRLPKDWGATLLAADVDSKRRLLQPEEAMLFGLQQTYEGFVGVGEVIDGKQGKLPFYCYLAVNNTTSRRARDPATALKSQLRNHGDTSKFQSVAITTPSGHSLEWRKATAKGPQEFYYVDAQGKERYLKQPGLIEFYSYTQGDYQMMICWRLPEGLRKHAKIEARSKLMAGSVTFPPSE